MGKGGPKCFGGSERNLQAKSVGPRRYVDGGNSDRWRWLTDVADDGAVFVLFSVCFKFFIEHSRLNSSRSGVARGILSEGQGKFISADLTPKFSCETR